MVNVFWYIWIKMEPAITVDHVNMNSITHSEYHSVCLTWMLSSSESFQLFFCVVLLLEFVSFPISVAWYLWSLATLLAYFVWMRISLLFPCDDVIFLGLEDFNPPSIAQLWPLVFPNHLTFDCKASSSKSSTCKINV